MAPLYFNLFILLLLSEQEKNQVNSLINQKGVAELAWIVFGGHCTKDLF